MTIGDIPLISVSLEIGIAGRHVVVFKLAKIRVVVIILPVVLVSRIVVAALGYPLVRLESGLGFLFGVVVGIEPDSFGPVVAIAQLLSLEYKSHN